MNKIRLLSFIVTSLLIFNLAANTKEEKWTALTHDVDTWFDNLGRPIDPEIKDAVIAFNALDMTTSASCEGHLDWGLAYPWIDFDTNFSERRILMEQLFSLDEERLAIEKKFKENNPGLTDAELLEAPDYQSILKLSKQMNALYEQLKITQLKKIEKIYQLLNEFYAEFPGQYDRILYLENERLQPLGSHFQLIRSEQAKAAALMEYRDEMNRLAAFLKERYFHN